MCLLVQYEISLNWVMLNQHNADGMFLGGYKDVDTSRWNLDKNSVISVSGSPSDSVKSRPTLER